MLSALWTVLWQGSPGVELLVAVVECSCWCLWYCRLCVGCFVLSWIGVGFVSRLLWMRIRHAC